MRMVIMPTASGPHVPASIRVGRRVAWVAGISLLVALAAVAFAWRADHEVLEIYYAAAVRSMSASWHDFAFGAFDPAGTISLDKLPGAFWVQALSVRIFGLHTWTIVLPQILEGAGTVVVLALMVRRQAGAAAGLLAAAFLIVSPATVALDRGNISDTLLILLMVLAAAATLRASRSGRLRTLLLAGLLVGLAFQAKMLEAWVLLPALAIPYALAAPGRVRRRLGHLLAAGGVVVVVSLSWMAVVSVIPAHSRPYVDGSHDNSLFAAVFQYNGLGRTQAPLAAAAQRNPQAGQLLNAFTIHHGPSVDRLFVGAAGRDIGWLLPAALISAVAILLNRRSEDRADPLRSAVLLWSLWLLTLLLVFSVAGEINPYYLAALAPPVAALCAMGLRTAVSSMRKPITPILLAATAAITAGYAVALLPGDTAPGWLAPAAGFLGGAAVAMMLATIARPSVSRLAVPAAVLAAVLVPAVAAITIAADGRGPFDTPFQPQATTMVTQGLAATANHPAVTIPRAPGVRYPVATYTSLLAAPLIYSTGQEVLPIGGFQGSAPAPTLPGLERLVDDNQVGVIIGPTSTDARMRWAANRCPVPDSAAPIPFIVCVGPR